MKVTLINYTSNAAEMLILAKQTRIGATTERLEAVRAMSESEKQAALTYAAHSVPTAWEFVDYTFLLEGVSRAFTHQLVRTRTGSYAQQAMRVVDASDFGYMWDEWYKEHADALPIAESTLAAIKAGYTGLLAAGAPTEVARGVLPTNVTTNILCKFNLRALAQFITSRLSPRVAPEMRSVAAAMSDAVIAVHPWAKEFIYPYGGDYWRAIEQFAAELPSDKGMELLKILDKMRGH